jgi:8-oxo-dGTP pyrophosphatase MutT (NUDIX family)
MDNLFRFIKVKSLAWIEMEGMTFVVTMPDSVKGDYYYRPIGGSVEYGETSLEAVKREAMEELHPEIEVTGEPLVVENIFTCEGKSGHEIDFIYPCSFLDRKFYKNNSFQLIEDDKCEFQALWIPIADCLNHKLRLVPESLIEWHRKQA